MQSRAEECSYCSSTETRIQHNKNSKAIKTRLCCCPLNSNRRVAMTSTTEVEEETTATIHIPEQWSEAAHRIASATTTSHLPIAFVCGAKNSGKTTFSRHLPNLLLYRYQKVAYLDTDIGQPEFTAPGFLSGTVVDKQMSGLLYVITPVPPSILEKVDLLLQGLIHIPTCLLQVQGCRSPCISANVLPSN